MTSALLPVSPGAELVATVSGSFRRAMGQVQDAVYALTDMGVHVLSPADPRVVAQLGDFLFVASDRLRSIRPVQNRHLSAIAASDFLWVVAPDGYVGLSVAMEVGYAAATGTPVYGKEAPTDATIREYITTVEDLDEAIRRAAARRRDRLRDSVLLDPYQAVELGHRDLEAIGRTLSTVDGDDQDARAAARRLERDIIRPLR